MTKASSTAEAVYRLRARPPRSEEHTSELQSHSDLVCRLLLEKKKKSQATVDSHPSTRSAKGSNAAGRDNMLNNTNDKEQDMHRRRTISHVGPYSQLTSNPSV